MNPATVTFLGTRGTIPVEGQSVSLYGGATVSILLSMGGEHILLDGGTGLFSLSQFLPKDGKPLHLLLSHPHFDHMSGIPSCKPFFEGQFPLHFYAAPRGNLTAEAQLRSLMSPPLWPVGPEVFSPPVHFVDIHKDFTIGAVRVRVMEGSHPGGCSIFRLEYQGKSLVYATDFELSASTEPVVDFARGCTLLLCDGQYSDEELPRMTHFGHSSWTQAAAFARQCGAGRLGVIHHAPWRTDEQLSEAERQLKTIFKDSFFAKQGGCITL